MTAEPEPFVEGDQLFRAVEDHLVTTQPPGLVHRVPDQDLPDPLGRFVFVMAGWDVYTFAVEAASGDLVERAHTIISGLRDFKVEPRGRIAYASQQAVLEAYAIDGETGALRDLGTQGPGGGPIVIVTKPAKAAPAAGTALYESGDSAPAT